MTAAPESDGLLSGPDAATTLAALGAAAPPLALVDALGRVTWCSQAFADAVAGLPAAELRDTDVSVWVGEGTAVAGDPWHVQAREVGGGSRLLHLQPASEPTAPQRTIAELRERLELVQDFCQAGIFERDPLTLEGRWDAQMYRIFGLPVPPPGAPAPSYDEVSQQYIQDGARRSAFRDTLLHPGPHTDRVRVRRPDGEIRHLHSQWKVFHDAQGQPVRVIGVNRDETEVYRLALEAKALREELDLALELADIGLWRHDLRTDRLYLDERASRHVGLPHRPQGVSLDQVRAQIHPEDVAMVQASADETLRTGLSTDQAIRYLRPEGGVRHVLSRRTLQRDVDGQPMAFVGVLLDESERVERARQAQAVVQRLESAAEAARIGLWSSRVDDQDLPEWNSRMYELFGLDPAAGPLRLGEWLRRCAHPDDRARVGEQAAQWFRKGSGEIEIEFRALHPDGRVRWLVTRSRIATPSPGMPRRAEGVTIDLTEQKETLLRLRDAVERMALTASVVGMGNWESVPTHDAGIWDEGMFRLRGRTSGVPEGRRRVSREEMSEYLHPDDRGAVMSDQRRSEAGGDEWRVTYRVVWPDGTVRWLASRSALVPGGPVGQRRRIGLNWDVTESVHAEQVKRERELAVAESRAKSRFLSRISHELRTPLNAVLGFAQLLHGDPSGSDARRREQWLGHIQDAGHHLLALIDDVLDLSRAESGELRLTLSPVDLADLVGMALPLVATEAHQHQVTVHVDSGVRGHVLADPLRLRQVLLNLLSNAIKYNRPGGRVRVSVRRESAQTVIEVADTGLGIDPARLDAAFEPFNRLGAERLGIQGTGIGLAITKALVELMQGRIEARSDAGQGSVFSVVLPSAEGSVTPPDAVPALSTGRRSEGWKAPAHVLYIEDNEVNALLVREVLQPHPWVRLETVPDGRSGLKRAREALPDLILLDMQLPDLDGLAVLRQLREDPATASVRCVALSANAMPEDIAEALAAGAIDYWTKPIQFAHFVEQLERLLHPP